MPDSNPRFRPKPVLTLIVPIALIAAWAIPARADVDIVYLLDTTGSMSGEIREAKERVDQLSKSLREARKGERIRIGVVAYRDRGDAYVTLTSPLSQDVDTTARFLAGLRAEGGGDGPEDVLGGIAAALRDVHWDERPGVEHQVFLIGDAPPHFDYPDDRLPESLIDEAKKRRIVLNTIGCRSLPDDGVAFFRKLAYSTEGLYQHIGHVRAQDPGLAEAMLKTLTDADEARPETPAPIAVKPVRSEETPHAGGILVRWSEPKDGAPPGCRIDVMLPAGVGLSSIPKVGLGSKGLEVTLAITQGSGGTETYELGRCRPDSTPIRVSFGG